MRKATVATTAQAQKVNDRTQQNFKKESARAQRNTKYEMRNAYRRKLHALLATIGTLSSVAGIGVVIDGCD